MNRLSPFKWFVLQNFPFIEADFDALTNYELMCKIVEYLNATIEKTNELGNQVEILTNWFNNLDVQEEINNKLDEMAESGELEEIITSYLQVSGVLCYNTLSDMQNATNLIDGSFARTFGKNTYNDKKGELYKIRTITSGDVVDGDNIVSVNFSETLIGEKQKNKQIEDIEKSLSLIENKKIIIIGDSYTTDDGSLVDITKHWYEYFAETLGLTLNTNLWVQATPGGGFVTGDFYDDLDDITDTISNLSEITDIFVVGGWNDRGQSESDLRDAMTAFNTLAKTKCPNAKITIGFVGKSNPIIVANEGGVNNNRTKLMPTIMSEIKISGELGFRFIKNAPYILHNYDSSLWEEDGVHPNQAGQTELGKQITFGFVNGFCDIHREDLTAYLTITASGISDTISPTNFQSGIHNDQAFLLKVDEDSPFYLQIKSGTTMNLIDSNQYNFGKISSGFVAGTGRICCTNCPAIFQYTSGSPIRVTGYVTIYIEAGNLFLKPIVYSNNSSLTNVQLDYIYLPSFRLDLPSMIA